MWGALRNNITTNVGGLVGSAIKFAEGLEKDLDQALGTANAAASEPHSGLPADPQPAESMFVQADIQMQMHSYPIHSPQGIEINKIVRAGQVENACQDSDIGAVYQDLEDVPITSSQQQVAPVVFTNKPGDPGGLLKGMSMAVESSPRAAAAIDCTEDQKDEHGNHDNEECEQQGMPDELEENALKDDRWGDLGDGVLEDENSAEDLHESEDVVPQLVPEKHTEANDDLDISDSQTNRKSSQIDSVEKYITLVGPDAAIPASALELLDEAPVLTTTGNEIVQSDLQKPSSIVDRENCEPVDLNVAKADHATSDLSFSRGEDEILKLQVALSEMEASIFELKSELTCKDADISSLIEKNRSAVRTIELKDGDITSLIDSRNECLVAMEQLKSKLKTQEEEHANEIRSLKEAMDALHAHRAEDVRAQEAARAAELSTLRKSLEAAQSESNEHKRLLLETKSRFLHMQDELQECQMKLKAFEEEGRVLAVKQSEMEKSVRKSRAELREKETEIKRLSDSRNECLSAIDQLNEKLREAEAAKIDEISSQKRALEASWSEANEYKRQLNDSKLAMVELRQQLGERLQKVEASELTVRDSEHRETMLRAANQQLQESLQRQMDESNARDERYMKELNDMRQRWQEAVSRGDALAKEISTVNSPLLLQVTKLQEAMQSKAYHYQTLEANLLERALTAERAAELAKQNELISVEKVSRVEKELTIVKEMEQQARACIQQLQVEGAKNSALLRDAESKIVELVAHAADLQAKWESAIESERQLQIQFKTKETKLKLEIEEARAARDHAVKQAELQISELEGRLRAHVGAAHNTAAITPTLPKRSTELLGIDQTDLPSGDASFVVVDRMQQLLHAREEDVLSLRQQLQQVLLGRQALAEEVAYLNSRNASLEEAANASNSMRELIQELEKEKMVLLEMVGEKNDEVQALRQDMEEVKDLYRAEIKELMDRVAPACNT